MRHSLDVMHIERNISSNLLKHLFREKDTPAVRRDMEAAGKFPHLHLRRREGSSDFVQPRAPYMLTNEEKQVFLDLVSRTRIRSAFSSTLIKHAGANWLAGLKSHDHHCLIQQVLPTAVRNLLHRGVRETVIKLGHYSSKFAQRSLILKKFPHSLTLLQKLFVFWRLISPQGNIH